MESARPDATIGSPAGTMTLLEYLRSRITELTIHGLDIVRAIDIELAAPTSALQESLAFIGRRSARKDGEVVLLALTGRGSLPVDYSVY
jgi:hypothetical protein